MFTLFVLYKDKYPGISFIWSKW